MSSSALTLAPDFPLGALVLVSDEDATARVRIVPPTATLVLELTPIVGGGGSGSSSGNLDGGTPTSNYGGIAAIDAGGP